MKLFSGLANAVAVLSGDTLCSISGPSRDPAAGVIEQTSGPFSVCPSNETKKAAANRNILYVWALDQRQATWNKVSDFEEEGFEDTDELEQREVIQYICISGLMFGYVF